MRPPTRPKHEASRAQRLEAMRVWLLGDFRVSIGSRTIGGDDWRLKKAAALVKLLALAPSHQMHREQIMNFLWPDSGRKAASNSLRKTLHVARKIFDPIVGARYLASEDESLVICPESDLWVDQVAFEEAAATARRAGDPSAYRAALDLYVGDLLPEDRYEEWTEDKRGELRRLYLELLVELAKAYEQRGELEWSVTILRMAVTQNPTLEEAYAGLMRLYTLRGQETEALSQYQRLEEILSTQLGTEPSSVTRRLREDISNNEFFTIHTQHAGALQESDDLEGASKHNLPAPRDSFVGRERELIEVKRALAMTRLLTLIGAGGSGKTRLALEVARDLLASYPDGVWLVELAPLAEGELVPQAVTQALGVHEQLGRSLTDTLVEALRQRNMLLILDNCEHLAEPVARVVDSLLNSCPRLRVLVTSRETLTLAGEVVWRVPSLSVPDTDRLPGPGEMTQYEAVRLFVERARLRVPAFVLTLENAPAVAEVCRKLEGIPLAIELATARVSMMSVGQISERLRDPLGLLSAGGRTVVPRQQTLRGTLDWSYELLSQHERRLFSRLSVFAGSWTLEAAEAIAAGEGLEQEEVLNLLSELVDKSLVVADANGESEMRYGMFEPVRLYALERLEESGEAQAVRHQHAAYFLALAEREPEAYKGIRRSEWTWRLEEEHDNLRAALSWSLESDEVEFALRLAGASQPFWFQRGYHSEGRGWLEAALAKDSGVSTPARVNALRGVGWLALWQGDIDRASAAAEEGLRLSPRPGTEDGIAIALLLLLGLTASFRADYERATGLFEESLELGRESGDEWGIAVSLQSLGNVAGDRDDNKRAVDLYEEGIALCRKSGYSIVLADTLTSLGYTLLLQGDHERAAVLNEEAAALYREQGYRALLEFPLDNLGWAALLRGDYERASTVHKESLVLCRELGDRMIAAESLEGLACVAGAWGEAERAATMFGAVQSLRETLGYHHSPEERALREPYLTDVRSRLDEVAWQAAFAEGQAMAFEQAVEYALSEEEPATPAPHAPEKPLDDKVPNLTRREKEITTLVARGLTNRQIARELSISEHTAATHVARILKKLGLRSRSQIGSWLSEQRDSQQT